MATHILSFLKDLKQNNDRTWFKENKERYDEVHAAFLVITQQLIDRIAGFDPEAAGLEAKDCLFRIYRDIRFSSDKSPYKTHMGAYIAQGGRKSERAGYYLHLEPGNSLLSGGLWMPAPRLLKMVRQDLYDQMDEFLTILEEPSFHALFPALEGDALKRNPEGFPAHFPHDEVIRQKDFCVSSHCPDAFFKESDWIDQAASAFEKLYAFNRFLNYTVDEYQGRN